MEEISTKADKLNKNKKRKAKGKDKPINCSSKKVRTMDSNNSTAYFQILGNGMDTQDTSPSILLFFEKQRFIFNAGEGLQRYCTEHGIKLAKIDHILLSRVCSETAGGLPGILLTLAGMGEEGLSVEVWGPSDLHHLGEAMESFISANVIHTRCFGPTPEGDGATDSGFGKLVNLPIPGQAVKISAIPIKPSSHAVCQPKENFTKLALNEGTEGPLKSGLALKTDVISVIYVCELPEIKGKFDVNKAKALGVPQGPKYGKLQCGYSVMSDDQNIMVHPSDVLAPSRPGPIVLLVDCPTIMHLQELVTIQSLNNYYSDLQLYGSKSVNFIIHLSPPSVTTTVTYQKWMARFGEAKHIMTGHEIKNMKIPILQASVRVETQLNYLCPQFFPASGFLSLQHIQDNNDLSKGSGPKLCDSISGENLMKIQLLPQPRLNEENQHTKLIPELLDQEKIVNQLISEIPEIVDSVECVRQLWNESTDPNRESTQEVVVKESLINGNASLQNMKLGVQNVCDFVERILSEDKLECPLPSSLEKISREDMEIVLLGTGSSQPSTFRNVSSIFVNLFSKGGLLLDCGEGTLGQLKRRYGIRGADDVVRSLRCIWISHIHADHHTGLTRILALRCELLRGVPHEPLLVIGPIQLEKFLEAYQKLEDLDMQFLDCRRTTEASMTDFESTHLKKVLVEANLDSLVSIPVLHCPNAFGLVVKAAERINSIGKTIPGWKLVYSGDTRPCPELEKAADGATVLIHEATFEDGMEKDADAKNHSTTKQAIKVGDKAYRIILSHFSQRYPKIPVFDETHMHKTCIGFDLMSINIADLHVLPKILPYLKLLFRDKITAPESEDMQDTLE
ncbi:hypothetical protein AQUCO_01700130v1 [Aquilegia coerulea]|uniref:ribonuclease Z n=1 Tax=Aquilegia coerulea TaxID=218851 RepID=A0A2G5DLC3_AQUCA|nr:hypothetical protein AQUCO_01700130v1 [Aquilegia coerulea]